MERDRCGVHGSLAGVFAELLDVAAKHERDGEVVSDDLLVVRQHSAEER